MKLTLNVDKIKKNIRAVSLSILGGAAGSLMLIAPSFATPAPAADYESIIETATAAVTNLGGLAMIAFGAAISPFIGRVAMLSIGSVFRSL